MIELQEETNIFSHQPLFEKVDDTFSNPLSPFALYKLLATTDCLFFIQYISVDTIKPRWLLVQINHYETEIPKIGSFRTEYYHSISSLAILLIKISVMMLTVDGLIGTSIIWMINIFLYMALVCV